MLTVRACRPDCSDRRPASATRAATSAGDPPAPGVSVRTRHCGYRPSAGRWHGPARRDPTHRAATPRRCGSSWRPRPPVSGPACRPMSETHAGMTAFPGRGGVADREREDLQGVVVCGPGIGGADDDAAVARARPRSGASCWDRAQVESIARIRSVQDRRRAAVSVLPPRIASERWTPSMPARRRRWARGTERVPPDPRRSAWRHPPRPR